MRWHSLKVVEWIWLRVRPISKVPLEDSILNEIGKRRIVIDSFASSRFRSHSAAIKIVNDIAELIRLFVVILVGMALFYHTA